MLLLHIIYVLTIYSITILQVYTNNDIVYCSTTEYYYSTGYRAPTLNFETRIILVDLII